MVVLLLNSFLNLKKNWDPKKSGISDFQVQINFQNVVRLRLDLSRSWIEEVKLKVEFKLREL